MRREPDKLQKSRDAFTQLGRSHAAEASVKRKKLGGSEPIVETKIFREKADLSPDFHIVRRTSQDEGLPATRFHETKQHLDGRALACSIRPEKTKNLSARNLQGKITYGNLRPKRLTQVLRFDRESTRRMQRRLLALIQSVG